MVDIGVLFVHGIGQQRRGDTLRDFGDPLVDAVGRWLGPSTVTRHPCAMDPGDPRHAEFTIDDGARTMRVLVAEAWWADSFRRPRYRPLLWWLVSAAPFVVQRAFDGAIRRTNTRIDECRPHRRRWGGLALLSGWRLLQNVVGVSLAIALDLLLIVLGALGVGRFFPIRRTLLAYIGDSYALLRDDAARDGIVGSVARSMDWLEMRAGGAPVVVAAHSQGAELVRRVLAQRDRDAPLASLITFGSGIEKLDAVRRLRGSPWASWAALGLRLVSVAGVVLSALAVAGQVGVWLAPLGLALGLLALSMARRVLRSIVGGTYTGDRLEVTGRQVGRWVDLYASRDPVPEGDLPLAGVLGVSDEIVNRRSRLWDHTGYRRNVEGFCAAVALELARIAGWRATTDVPPQVARAQHARTARVRLLAWSHRVIALATVAGWVVLETQLVLALALAAAAAATAVLTSLLWTAWSNARTRALFDRRADERRSSALQPPARTTALRSGSSL
jgi:hypothetical protein